MHLKGFQLLRYLEICIATFSTVNAFLCARTFLINTKCRSLSETADIVTVITHGLDYYARPVGGGIIMLSDVGLSDVCVCLSRTLGISLKQRGLGRLKLAQR